MNRRRLAALALVVSTTMASLAAQQIFTSKDDVTRTLSETGGNKALAARNLGISRRALYRLIEKYDLEQR